MKISEMVIKHEFEISEKEKTISEKLEEISVLDRQLEDSKSQQVDGASQIDKKDEIISELKKKVSTQIDELLKKDKIIFENHSQIEKLRKSSEKMQELTLAFEKIKECLKFKEEAIEQLNLEAKKSNIKNLELETRITGLSNELSLAKDTISSEALLKDKFFNGGKELKKLWIEKDQIIEKYQHDINRIAEKDKEITRLKTELSQAQLQVKKMTVQSWEKWKTVEEWKEKTLNIGKLVSLIY